MAVYCSAFAQEYTMSLSLECHICGPLANNVYLWFDEQSREAMLVDPGIGSEFIAERITRANLVLRFIIDTHGHFDHTFNNRFFKNEFPESRLLIHKADAHMLRSQSEMAAMFGFDAESSPDPDGFISAETSLKLGEHAFDILEIPGHSPGGIAIINGLDALVGDALFAGGIGRTDLPGSDHEALIRAIRTKLYALPDDTRIHPGHGSSTTIGVEKRSNPFVREMGGEGF